MGFKCGIVGLPNVGKSTIFNAITNTANAQAANYPFCTIEPNIGRVAVPDERINILAKIANSKRVIPTSLDIVDIAGLVRGASKGEGLGNQFLGNIREVDAIMEVVRCFEDDDITHVENSIDPIRDIEVIETELLLADAASLEKRIQNLQKKAKNNDKSAATELAVCEKILQVVNSGKMAIETQFTAEELPIAQQMQLLTDKKVMYVANIDEGSIKNGNAHLTRVIEFAKKRNAPVVTICAKMESEIIDFSDDEKQAFLVDAGFGETSLGRIIKTGSDLLGLLTFFTVGETETRAWNVIKGATAPQAAGVIHTDFEKGFIKAETISYEDYVAYSGESGAKEAGKMRLEGKEYIVKDGDIFHFKFNV
jgi:GTP-binding protein YchF